MHNVIDIKTELIALKTVSQGGPPNAHIIHVFDSWFHYNAEEHVTRTFVKMQLCEGTLKEYLDDFRNSGGLIEPLEVTEIMIHILSGLCVCHEKGICHRDLSLTNSMFRSLSSSILVMYVEDPCDCHQSHGSKRRWLITDFGFAMVVNGDTVVLSHRRRGTNLYRAPELVEKCEASKKSDIWAVGCILYRVATMDAGKFWDACQWEATGCGGYRLSMKTPRLDATHNSKLLKSTSSSQGDLGIPFYQELNSILDVCFERDAEERPTADGLKMRFEEMRSVLLDNDNGSARQPQALPDNAERIDQINSNRNGIYLSSVNGGVF